MPPEPAALIQEGLREARQIGHPVARARHLYAWALRQARVDPEAAAAHVGDFVEEPDAAAQLVLAVATQRALRGDTDLDPLVEQVLTLGREADPDTRLRLLNGLSEAAIKIAEQDTEAAVGLLRRLVPEARSLAVPESDTAQPRALATALVAEALYTLDAPEGRELLDEVAALCEEIPAREPLLQFLAGILAERYPERAAEIAASLQDPGFRLDARLQIMQKTADEAFKRSLFDGAEQDALQVEHWHGPEAVVRLASGVGPFAPDRARALFERALQSADATGPQMRSLQRAGVASAVADFDREWGRALFEESIAGVLEEPELARRAASLVLIANEMAEVYPRESAGIFARALEEAEALEAPWELAHVLEIIFRSDRSPYIDISGTRPLLERALERMSGDDPHFPGMFGLADVAQCLLQIDPPRAVPVLRQWFEAAEEGMDSGGMTRAALAIHRADSETGMEYLTRARDFSLKRTSCTSMGDFCRQAAAVAPELVLSVAPKIPDSRERAEAFTGAAVRLLGEQPEEAVRLARSLDRPVDRSNALLALADHLLGSADLPIPEPLLEELP